MTDWWTSIPFEQQLYLGAALAASTVLVVMLVLNLLGTHAIDEMPDLGDGTHGSGLGVFSLRAIAAFFAGLGWMGTIFLRQGASSLAAAAIGTISGLALMAGTIYLMRSFVGMQSSGTLSYENAVGSIGTVYVPVPSGRAVGGQVEVLIQGRIVFAEAISDAPTTLPRGAKVRIAGLVGQSCFIVEAA